MFEMLLKKSFTNVIINNCLHRNFAEIDKYF